MGHSRIAQFPLTDCLLGKYRSGQSMGFDCFGFIFVVGLFVCLFVRFSPGFCFGLGFLLLLCGAFFSPSVFEFLSQYLNYINYSTNKFSVDVLTSIPYLVILKLYLLVSLKNIPANLRPMSSFTDYGRN